MSKDNIFTGYAAELRVATRFLENNCPVFFGLVPDEIDLVAKLDCGHLVSIQTKLAYESNENYSFHAGKYFDIDYYAIVSKVWMKSGWLITWIPTQLVEANSHAALTKEMKLGFFTSFTRILS